MKRISRWLIHRLLAISPVDGRYRKDTEPLAEFVSEFGLIRYRIMVEVEYLIAFFAHDKIPLKPFTADQKCWLRSLYLKFNLHQAETIKNIETRGYGRKKSVKPGSKPGNRYKIQKTNHDVNAVVRYVILRMEKHRQLRRHVRWVHFALTSEDINNIAYGLMLSDVIHQVLFPVLKKVIGAMSGLAECYKSLPMLARTHGQPASPTTLGKEFNNFVTRLTKQKEALWIRPILVKLNGANGTYNAHYIAFPEVDWIKFTDDFIAGLNQGRQILLRPNFVTTQIEPHDTLAELFDNLKRIDTILIDFCQDMWRYISDEWIVQKPVEGEDGSSTLPQKINPIQIENSEGNNQIAVALFEFFARTLPISRLQRHLSDSTIERNFGVAMAHTLIAYKSILRGLDRMVPNPAKIIEDLERRPEVISEAIQIVLRREGITKAYDRLKELTRGKLVTLDILYAFVRRLRIKSTVKQQLQQVTPTNYTGLAKILATRNG